MILLHLMKRLEETGGCGVVAIGAAGGVGESVLIRHME